MSRLTYRTSSIGTGGRRKIGGGSAERPSHMSVCTALSKERKVWPLICRAGGNRCMRCVRGPEVDWQRPLHPNKGLGCVKFAMFPDPAWPRIPCFQHSHSTGTGSITRMQQWQSCMLPVETPYPPALTSINPSSNNTSSPFLCHVCSIA